MEKYYTHIKEIEKQTYKHKDIREFIENRSSLDISILK